MDNSNHNDQNVFHRFICNFASGIIFILCGVFLLLVGLKLVPLALGDVLLPSLLLSLGIIFVFTAFAQKNSVSLWMSAFFILPAVIVLLVVYSEKITYANAYPCFIFVPAFASLFTLLISREYRVHFCCAAFFGILSAIFFLHSLDILGWNAVVPFLIIFFGTTVLIFSIFKRYYKKTD